MATSSDSPGVLSETFRPERTHLLSAIVLTLISLLGIGAAPLYLFWILIFPALFVFWVLRSSTVVDEKGIHAHYAFRADRSVAWDEVAGIGFKGSRTFVRTGAGAEFTLPGVTFNSLPRLQQASYGRIPDALTAGHAAQDGKVVVVNEEGYSVLMTKEEYIERQHSLGREVELDFDEDDIAHDVSGPGNNAGTSPVESGTETPERS